MATLRRYSIVKTRKQSKLFSPERAILGLFVVAAGAGVFLSVDKATKYGDGPIQQLARGEPMIKIPIAHQIAQTLNRVDKGLNRKSAPLDPARVAAMLAEKQRQSETEQRLAAERRVLAGQMFAKNNIDPTPVATIPAPASTGFTELRPSTATTGFQELPRWQPK